jgi:hypothetical protein
VDAGALARIHTKLRAAADRDLAYLVVIELLLDGWLT